jgi:hypothetical protein
VDLEVRKFQDSFNHENCTGDELGEIKKTLGKNIKDPYHPAQDYQ